MPYSYPGFDHCREKFTDLLLRGEHFAFQALAEIVTEYLCVEV